MDAAPRQSGAQPSQLNVYGNKIAFVGLSDEISLMVVWPSLVETLPVTRQGSDGVHGDSERTVTVRLVQWTPPAVNVFGSLGLP
jgi:hypothetical protein